MDDRPSFPRHVQLRQTRWDREVDPDCVLPLAERYRRADAARAAFYVAQGLLARKRNRWRKAAESEGVLGQASGREIGGAAAAISPEERRLIGRLGGLAARAKHDPRATTEAARAAAEAAYEQQVDPDGLLSPAERARRARAARAAFFTSLALRSLNARAKRRVHGRDQAGDEKRVAQLAATQRRLRGRLGAYTRLAQNDPATITAHARETTEMHWRRLVDPFGMLAPDELEDKVREAKGEHFRRLAQLSAEKRAATVRSCAEPRE